MNTSLSVVIPLIHLPASTSRSTPVTSLEELLAMGITNILPIDSLVVSFSATKIVTTASVVVDMLLYPVNRAPVTQNL